MFVQWFSRIKLMGWLLLCLPAVAAAQNPFASEQPSQSAAASPSAFQDLRQTAEAELRMLQESGRTDPFAEAKRLKLTELSSIFAAQETALRKKVTISRQLASVENEVAHLVGLLNERFPENSFLAVVELEAEDFLHEAREQSLKMLESSTEQSVAEQAQLAEEITQKRRLVKEKLLKAPTLSGEEEVELLVLDQQIADESLKQLKLQLESYQLALASIAKQRSLLEAELRRRDSQVIFTLNDLHTLQQELSKRMSKLQQQMTAASAELKRAENSARKQLPELELLHNRAEYATVQQLETRRAHRLLLDKLKTIWQLRYAIRSTSTEAELRSALIRIERMASTLETEAATQSKMLSALAGTEDYVQTAGTELLQQFEPLQVVQSAVNSISRYAAETQSALFLTQLAAAEAKAKLPKESSYAAMVDRISGWLSRSWNFELWAIDDTPITLGKLLLALLLLLFGMFLSRILSLKLEMLLQSKLGVASGPAAAVHTVVYYLLLVVAAVIALQTVHIPLTVFTLAGGALAIGVGFGSQNIVNNFFSGLILFFEQPLRVGDIIEFAGNRGTVQRIGSRSTTVLTPENLEVFVPNSTLIENSVTNWTKTNRRVRRSISVGVAYGSDAREVQTLLESAAAEHGEVLKEPVPQILFRDFGDSALIFEVRFWTIIGRYSDVLRLESDLRHLIYRRFKECGVVIAFPQRDVHVDLQQETLRVELVEGRSQPRNE